MCISRSRPSSFPSTGLRPLACDHAKNERDEYEFLDGHYSLPFFLSKFPCREKFEILDSNCSLSVILRSLREEDIIGERMLLIHRSVPTTGGIRNDARPRDTIKKREHEESLRVVGLLTFPGARFWHRDPTFFARPTDISLHSHAWNESRATLLLGNAAPLCKARDGDPRAVDHVALVIHAIPRVFIVAVHHRFLQQLVFSFRSENLDRE